MQFAQLLGVHPLTVTKWERGILVPPPHEAAMIRSFGRAAHHQDDVGQQVVDLLLTAGVAFAVYKLLEAAFGGE